MHPDSLCLIGDGYTYCTVVWLYKLKKKLLATLCLGSDSLDESGCIVVSRDS